MRPPIRWGHGLRRLCVLLAKGRWLSWTIILLIVQGTAAFAATLEVVRERPEVAGDTRYDHYWQLLAQALAITEPDFGPFALRESALPMTERRALEELETGSDTITVLVHGNVADYEQRLLPVRFPLDKGLLGYRVFLISSDMQSRVELVRGLDDLRRYSIGQGRGWGDVTILRQAGLNVVEGTSYEGLFAMLAAGRFELFSRSVVEVAEELAREKPAYPALAIEQHLLLFYPLTRYFYVARSPAGDALARRISEGLERMLKDGSFERMFQAFKSQFEQQIGFRNRLLIRIANPLQTPETPLNRPELWYDPKGER
jgi:ABC-type amino acid transport substrate-binding protein